MSPAKKASGSGRKSPAKKSTTRATKKSASKRTASKKKPAARATKKSTARKAAANRTTSRTSKKATAKKAPARKTGASKATAKKTPARKAAAKTATAKKVSAKKTQAKKTVAAAPPKKTSAKPVAEVPKKILPASRPFVRPTPTAPPKRKVRPAKFDAEQLKKIRGGLETKRGELEQRMAELEEDSFDSTQSDITGEVGLDEDFADAGTATFERERDLSIRNNIRDLIDQMNRAIERIDAGSYGTCERCGQPIDAARLRELPHALLCLDCKRREERAR